MKQLVISVLGLLILVCDAGKSSAAVFDLLHTFDNPSPSSYDGFGWSLAASGDYVLIGSPANVTGNSSSLGSAHLFSASTGNLLQTFNNPATGVRNDFGYSVAVTGDTILVGAPGAGNLSAEAGGAAYQFEPTGGLQQTYLNPTPALNDGFGYSVASVGEKTIVGAPGDDTQAVDAGTAYLFNDSSGHLVDAMPSPSPAAYEIFGRSVASMGDRMIVGAPGKFGEPGVAYLLDEDGSELHTFHSPSGPGGEFFGYSVAAVGENVLVGAPGDWKLPSGLSGKAYLFSGITGQLLRTFENPTPATEDRFGISVAGVGNHILIGASGDDTAGMNAGAAYLFDETNGQLLGTLLNPAPDFDDRFGNAVAFSGNNILVGAFGDGTASGTAYLFQGVPEPTTLTLFATAALAFLTCNRRRRTS